MNAADVARDAVIGVLVVGCAAAAALMLHDGWWLVLLSPSILVIADFSLVVAWLVRRQASSGSRHE